jgi:hypothetical protein
MSQIGREPRQKWIRILTSAIPTLKPVNSERVPEIVDSQANPAAATFRLESAVAKESVETHPGIPKVIGSAIFSLKHRCLRCNRESGLASCIQPLAQFISQISTKWDKPDATFTWPDAKACLPQIEICNAQTECFAKSQAGAIQNQEQRSHACESQWRALQIGYAAQKKLDLFRCEYASLKMSSYRRDG